MTILPPNAEGIAQAAALLRTGDVVAYPTETVYGLAADPFNETALRKLFAIKGRPETNPVLLIVADAAQIDAIAATISERARRCMDTFWPGPLSLLFPAKEGLSTILTANTGKICARQTACAIARDLCRAFGAPLTSTSANQSGLPPALSPKDLNLPGLAAVLDGGSLEPSTPSTICDPDTAAILRAGCIPSETILQCLSA